MSERYKVKLQLTYDGTDFNGFQKQKEPERTVQGSLEKALSKLLDEPIQVVGAGRTDRGVHAINQYAHFWTTKNPKNYKLLFALNGYLTPKSLVIKKSWLAPEDFHAMSSIRKTYKYMVLNRELPSALRRNHLLHVRQPLDIDYLNDISKEVLGEHDFSSFQTSGTIVKTTIKQIFTSSWSRHPGDILVYTVAGDGFLRQMVRNLVGTFLWAERTKAPTSVIKDILGALDRQAAKDTAPAHGLYIYDVEYSNHLDNKCLEI